VILVKTYVSNYIFFVNNIFNTYLWLVAFYTPCFAFFLFGQIALRNNCGWRYPRFGLLFREWDSQFTPAGTFCPPNYIFRYVS